MIFRINIIMLFIFAVLTGCTHMPTRRAVDNAAQAEDFAESGMQAFEEGNWKEAAISFDRALKLDSKCAEAYAGMALVLAQNRQFEKAFDYADKAEQQKSAPAAAKTAKGRIYLMTQKPENIKPALAAFDEALKSDPKYEAALFYKATALMQRDEYDNAQTVLTSLIKLQGQFMEKAAQKLHWLQKLQIAAPKTETGKKLMTIEAITRADLAALLAAELQLPALANRRNPKLYDSTNNGRKKSAAEPSTGRDSITDISDNWAESWIRDVVRVGGMDIFPDRTFRPDEEVRRMDFALSIQKIAILVTGNRSIDTAFIGSPSPFPDVKQSHYAYNAIAFVAERGIMSPDPRTGEFHMNEKISGIDALIALRKLQAILDESS